MSKLVDIDNFGNELVNILTEFTAEVEEGMEDAKEEKAKEGMKKLKSTSPKKSGKYAKSWRAKKVGNAWVVHNATRYQLTHLLEKGYAKVNGGRVAPRVHIAPVEDEIIVGYEKQLERIIKGG